MSYNTRRSTAPAGRGQSTQVNYHQQPSRPGATLSQQQSRNPGYTTTPSPNYNSASQPAYSTQQPVYSTTPPQQTQAPAATQSPPTQPPPTQPPPTQPPATQQPPSTPTVNLKEEPVTPVAEASTTTPAAENGEGTQNKPYWKKKPFFKVSNKVKRARQNAKLRRLLNPKNALTFLNELKPGSVKFNVHEEAGWGFIATVEIDGQTYSGHGMSLSKAKIQASEQALKQILLQQMTKSYTASASAAANDKDETKQADEPMDVEDKEGQGEESKPKKQKTEPPEDGLPWGSLAAYAMHKLFETWQNEGNIPAPSLEKYNEEVPDDEAYYGKPGPEFGYPRRPTPGAAMHGRGGGYGPYPPRGFMGPRRFPPSPASVFLGSSSQRNPINLGNAPLTNVCPKSNRDFQNVSPMKKIPEDANKRNPVMLLNQLRPNIIYNETREGEGPGVVFKITINLDGNEYVGRGKSKKDAKRMVAKAALAPMGVVYEDDN